MTAPKNLAAAPQQAIGDNHQPIDVIPVAASGSNRRALLIAGIALAVLFAAIFAWRILRFMSAAAAYAPPPPVEVSAMAVRSETLPQATPATGSLSPVAGVTLAPEVAGRIVSIAFTAGEHVGRSAVVIRLYDAPERADRAAAVAKANFAATQVARSRALAPSGAEPRELLQSREADLTQARAAIQQIDARLAQKIVRAPFAGELGVRRVNLGQYVNAGDPIATLTALDRLYVNFTVPQQQLAQLRVGGDVAVQSDALPGRSFTARIRAVEPVVGGDTRNVQVQAEMPNPGRALRPGVFVSVGIAQPPRTDVILLPTTAIQTSASGDSVLVVRGGKAVPVPVVTGSQVGNRVVVEQGLKPGDMVVTEGQLRVQPGGAVTVARAPAARR